MRNSSIAVLVTLVEIESPPCLVPDWTSTERTACLVVCARSPQHILYSKHLSPKIEVDVCQLYGEPVFWLRMPLSLPLTGMISETSPRIRLGRFLRHLGLVRPNKDRLTPSFRDQPDGLVSPLHKIIYVVQRRMPRTPGTTKKGGTNRVRTMAQNSLSTLGPT